MLGYIMDDCNILNMTDLITFECIRWGLSGVKRVMAPKRIMTVSSLLRDWKDSMKFR